MSAGQGHRETRAEVEALVRAHFPEDAETINGCLLPAVTFQPCPRADGRVALRLGGGVRLPAAVPWPVNGDRDLYFLAEVDLAAVGPLDVTGALPTSGSLLFFYDIISHSWGLDPADSAPWRVVHIDEDDAQSLPVRHRRPHETDDLYVSQAFIDPSELPDAVATWTIPMTYEPCVAGTTYGSANGPEYWARREDFDAINDCLSKEFQMLGWPYYQQPNSRQWAVEVASSGRPWEDLTAADVADWRLLMQFPKWDEYGGTNWGGPAGGMLEYWIRDSDLRAARFDRVWIQMDAC